MVARCGIPTASGYSNYGGKGIRVCDRWKTFENFLEDMGEPEPTQSIDRIDPRGNYEPANCRWAAKATQARNTTRNVMLSMHGKTQCLSDWATEHGLKVTTLYMRIFRSGMTLEQALTKPLGRWSK